MSSEGLAILAAIVGVAHVLATIVGRLVDRIAGGSGVLSESDKAFFREMVYSMREEFENHRGLLHAQRERIERGNELLDRLVRLTDSIERRGGER